MKKRSFTLLLTALLLLVCMAVFTSCALGHTHSFGEWTTVKAATCVEAGEQERLCSCGEKQTQAIPATGHS
ncbi:MAG: hypothetical protein MJ101_04800, partial [Clostridia bacterium]|nr:hypothetical protein [Clostridia bacterium]